MKYGSIKSKKIKNQVLWVLLNIGLRMFLFFQQNGCGIILFMLTLGRFCGIEGFELGYELSYQIHP